jgi:hypothetical protein
MERGVSYAKNMHLMHMLIAFYCEYDIFYSALTVGSVKFMLYL